MDAHVGGTSLVSQANHECWSNLDRAPLASLLERLSLKVDLRAIWWIQGENEALTGDVTEQQYLDALIRLRLRIEGAAGRGTIPFMVSPIAAPHELYPYSRAILAAQYRSVQHGFILGPEYYDLEHNREHLTDPGRIAFTKRAAAILAPLI